jgi:hypothetical protein
LQDKDCSRFIGQSFFLPIVISKIWTRLLTKKIGQEH